MNIKISEHTYERLSKHSVGFEQPEDVLIRLLDFYENRKSLAKPEIAFLPDEASFKKKLLEIREAWKNIEYTDGSNTVEKWIASRITDSSNIKANLWSGSLRDWEIKGIRKITLSIDKPESCFKESDQMNGVIEIQVGKFIQNHLDAIASYCESNERQLRKLMDLEWSKLHLGLSSFPFIKATSDVSSKEKREGRYWERHKRFINGIEHSFCSQFGGKTMVGTKTLSEQHGKKMIDFLKAHGLLLSEYKNTDIKFIVKS